MAKKKLTFWALALSMCLIQIAYGAEKDMVGNTPLTQTNDVANKKVDEMKLLSKN